MKPKFAIIGCGRIAKRHAEQINKVGKLVAVCDIVLENAAELAKEYDAKIYLSIEDLLINEKEVDIVSICTPNGLHAEHAIKSLKAHKHVLCEKPMSINGKDGHAMINASLIADRRLFIVKSARYNPLVAALKKLIDDDRLGNIYSFHLNCSWNRPSAYYSENWRGTYALDGGTLYTQFSHYIDILFWLLGEHSSLAGYRKNLHHTNSIEFEDTGAISLEMKSGAIGTIHYSINACDMNHEICLNIVAEKGTIQLGGEFMNKLIYQQPAFINTALITEINTSNDYGFYKGSMSKHDMVYTNVLKALKGEDNNVTDGADALKAVLFIEEFYNKIKLS